MRISCMFVPAGAVFCTGVFNCPKTHKKYSWAASHNRPWPLKRLDTTSAIAAVRKTLSDSDEETSVWIFKIKKKKNAAQKRVLRIQSRTFWKQSCSCVCQIHPNQWKINDMRTCWHVEVYANSTFGSGSAAAAAEEDLRSHRAQSAALEFRAAQLGR